MAISIAGQHSCEHVGMGMGMGGERSSGAPPGGAIGTPQRALLDTVPDGIFFVDPSGRVVDVNEGACRQLGYTRDELVTMTLAEISGRPGFDLTRVRDRITSEKHTSFTSEHIRKDGSRIPVEVMVSLLEHEGQWLMLGVARDLTHQRAAAETIARSEHRYRSLVENLPGTVAIMFDRDLRFVLVDGPEVAATGFSKEGMEGRALRDALPAQFADAVEGNMRRVLAGERFSAELPFGEAVFHYEYVPLRDRSGAVEHGLILGQNITERVVAVRALAEREARLRQVGKLDALGRLAGGVAHDFNNLLTAIQSYTHLLLRNANLDAVAREDLEQIDRASERGSALTTQLLAFSRKHVIEPVYVDLDDLIRKALRMLQRLLGEDIEISFVPGCQDVVHVDPGQLEQVLMNLAANARDAMPRGGRLAISTVSLTFDAPPSPVGAQAGRYIRLRVRDSGLGMSAETLDHLYEPFYTTKETGKGTGLGLSIMYGIVHQSAGFIEVASELGVGSTFDVYLPAHDRASMSVARTVTPRRVHGSASILLVEDEPQVLAVTTRVLRDHGFLVHPASLPTEALTLAGDPAIRIDLVLTDVIMPGMNGPVLVSCLRELRPELKALFMSGYTNDALSHVGLGEAVHFLQKPFVATALVAKVVEVLGEPEPSQRPR